MIVENLLHQDPDLLFTTSVIKLTTTRNTLWLAGIWPPIS